MAIQKVGFVDYCLRAINHNYYFGIVITSHTQALLPSDQLPFGQGKTTLSMDLSCKLNSRDYMKLLGRSKEERLEWNPTKEDWDTVFRLMVYNPCDLRDMLEPGSERKNYIMWDGVPYTCPRTKGVPRFLVKIRGELTESRPEVAIVGFTCPNRNDISAPLRSLPSFELIVSRRGIFEVQRTKKFKVFNRPEEDAGQLEYVDDGTFPQLPREVEERYERWRIEQKKYVKTSEYQKRLRDLIREADAVSDDGSKPSKIERTIPKSHDFLIMYREHRLKGNDTDILRFWQDLYKQTQPPT